MSALRQRLLTSGHNGVDRTLPAASLVSASIKQPHCSMVSRAAPAQSVSLYLLGEDYLRIAWLFLAVGTGGVFAMPAFIGLTVPMRALFGIGLLVLPSVWTGVFLLLTGKYYKEAGHKYPSLNLRSRRAIIILPFGTKWKQTWVMAREYAELRLATLYYTLAFLFGCFTLGGSVCTLILVTSALR